MYFEPIPKNVIPKDFEADWLFIEETADDWDFEQAKGACASGWSGYITTADCRQMKILHDFLNWPY